MLEIPVLISGGGPVGHVLNFLNLEAPTCNVTGNTDEQTFGSFPRGTDLPAY